MKNSPSTLRKSRFLLAGLFLTLASGMSPATVVNLKTDFGAAGNGVTDDRNALVNALQAVSGGGVLIIPESVYNIATDFNVALSGDVKIIGLGNAVLKVNGCRPSISSASSQATPVDNMARGDREIYLTSNSVLAPGSIITITCDTDGEPGWGYNKQDTHLIESVALHEGIWIVTLETPLNFSYSTSESNLRAIVYEENSLNIAGVNMQVSGDPTNTRFSIVGFKNGGIDGMHLEPITGSKALDGPFISCCVNFSVTNMSQRNARYGVLVSACRDVYLNHLRAEECHHPVSPCNFSNGVYINDLVGTNCTASMDSHPAFEVHYNRVRAYGDTGMPNLRSVGGSIRNSVFNSTATQGTAYMGSVAMADMSIYEDYEFLMQNVEWNMPYNNEKFAGVGAGHGKRATFINVKAKTMVFAGFQTVDEVHIIGCETGHIYSRQPKLYLTSSVVDGSLFPGTATSGLLDFVHQLECVFSDSTFKNAPYAVWSDFSVLSKRSFIRCSFEDISEKFDHFGTAGHGYAGYSYTYWFDACSFTDVAGYGTEISGSNSRAHNCTFTGGPVLNPQ